VHAIERIYELLRANPAAILSATSTSTVTVTPPLGISCGRGGGRGGGGGGRTGRGGGKKKQTNDEVVTTSNNNKGSLLMSLPLSLRMMILNFFNGSVQEELRQLPLVSKQFKRDCHHDDIEWKFKPLLEIGRIAKKEVGFFNRFEFQFGYHRDKFQHYVHMIVHDLSTFTIGDEAEESNAQLNGILSLDLYSQTKIVGGKSVRLLASILPNLRELNVKQYVEGDVLQSFQQHCPDLEKVTIKEKGDDELDKGGVEFCEAIVR